MIFHITLTVLLHYLAEFKVMAEHLLITSILISFTGNLTKLNNI